MMELDREDLKALVKGNDLDFMHFNHPLVLKAGHSYIDCYGKTEWKKLDHLTDDELHELYLICKNG